MKYLYYSLYWFYVKIIQLQKQYPPIINITAVISLLLVMFLCSILNAYYYDVGYKYPPYHFIFPGMSYLVLWRLLYIYYKPREIVLINEIECKSLWFKALVGVVSLIFIITIIKLWMFDGSFKIYQLLKQKLYSD